MNQVLSRYRFRSNIKEDGSSRPTVQVEALVLNKGTWTTVPVFKKHLLSMNIFIAIKLAAVKVAWYSPTPALRLATAMGYMRSSVDVPLPEEFKYRWIIQVAMKRSDVGGSAEDKKEYDKYMRMDNPLQSSNHQRHPLPTAKPI